MKVNRKKLVTALDQVVPGLAGKEIIEQTHSFIFKDGEVLTFNDEISVRFPINIGIEGAVKASEFHKLISKLKDTEIELTQEKGEIRVKGKRTRAGISMESEISMPLDEIQPPEKWDKLPKDFGDAVSFCLFSVSTDMTKPILRCLSVKGSRIISSDDFRITKHRIKKIAKEFLIPGSVARQLIPYKPVKYAIVEGWLHFKNEEGVIFSCRTYQEKYPNVTKFLDVEGVEVVLPKKLPAILERAGIFTKTKFEQDSCVKILIKKGKIIVKGKGDSGWMRESCNIKYKGEPVEFIINHEFFAQTLELLRKATIGDTSLKLTGDRFVHVVRLIAEEKGDEEGTD